MSWLMILFCNAIFGIPFLIFLAMPSAPAYWKWLAVGAMAMFVFVECLLLWNEKKATAGVLQWDLTCANRVPRYERAQPDIEQIFAHRLERSGDMAAMPAGLRRLFSSPGDGAETWFYRESPVSRIR